MNFRYNHTPFGYKRRQTREVKVGDVKIGGNNPIVIQSMINSDTTDTKGTVKQILELERTGCEIVRLTVPSQVDADNLPSIRQELKKVGSKIPLVADIHFTPSVAMKAVEYVEKVRINPGNFADKKKLRSERLYGFGVQRRIRKDFGDIFPSRSALQGTRSLNENRY